MELTSYVERLRGDLTAAAAAGGPEAQAAAERLALALDPATRMVLLEALSQAADEITGALDQEAVDVRMNGREPEFVVTRLESAAPPAPPAPPEPPAAPEPEDGTTSRITLRLEKHFGTWFREYRPIYTPLEAGMDRYLKFDHEFVGRAAVEAELAAGGPRRRDGEWLPRNNGPAPGSLDPGAASRWQ